MPEKRRLLFVSHEMTLSGAPIQLAYLVQWLAQHGWEVVVVTPEPGPLESKLEGVEVIYESQLLIDPAYGALRRLAPGFDAVVANTIATWEAVQACHFERVPVIWYIHETRVGLQLMRLIHLIEPSLGLADTIVTPTQTTARIYSAFTPKDIEVIPYGIPEVPSADGKPDQRLRISVIGTFESRKGQDVLIEAIHQLTREQRAGALFRFAGRNLEVPFYDALRERAASLENVEFLNALGHEEAMRVLAQSDALVLPSRDETMPIVLLEAMSLAKPIVCADVGGIREWIHDGENGLVVPPEDPAALAMALVRLVTDQELRAKLAAGGRETFERHFTLDRYGELFAATIARTITAYCSVA